MCRNRITKTVKVNILSYFNAKPKPHGKYAPLIFLLGLHTSVNVLLFESFFNQIYWIISKYIYTWNYAVFSLNDKPTVRENQLKTLNRCFKHVFIKICFCGTKNKFEIPIKEYLFLFCSLGYIKTWTKL